MKLSVKSDIDKVMKHLDYISKKQVPFAASKAINATAYKVKQGLDKSTHQYIDRPAPASQRPTAYRASSKRNLVATVYLKPRPSIWLPQIIEGRPEHGVAVPTGARTNRYGNLTRGYVKNRKAKPKFFSGTPKGRNRPKGLYERTRRNKGLKQHAVYKDTISHSKKWPYQKIANRIVARHFKREMDKALFEAINSPKRR